MARPADVLAYVSWVEWLLEVEQHRQDPTVEWQRDMSWDEMAACAGCEMPEPLRLGERHPNVEIDVQLYWPAVG